MSPVKIEISLHIHAEFKIFTGHILDSQSFFMWTTETLIRPRGYKTFFMLNSAEHEICLANKSQITNGANSFLLNIAEYENFSVNKYENANYCWHFHIY